jgi:hypothetical protein
LDHPVFTSSDFATVIYLQIKVVSLASNPNLEDQVSVFTGMSPRDRGAQLYHQPPGSLFIAFYDSQGYGRCIPIGLFIYLIKVKKMVKLSL